MSAESWPRDQDGNETAKLDLERFQSDGRSKSRRGRKRWSIGA
jgi:hypothetical protein